MGVLEFGGHTVRGSSQSACFKPRKKHHAIGDGVWGIGRGVVTLYVRGGVVLVTYVISCKN